MTIKEILNKRSSNNQDEINIDSNLYNLLINLETDIIEHLKRITKVLKEFDLHDDSHSKKVVSNIENLIGEEKLNSLSSYELFLLYLSSFLHDCAMAVSDWELNVMEITEGTQKYFLNPNSLKHDLKPPLSFSEAVNIIKENKQIIYNSFDSDVKEWMFSPEKETDLITYLANLLKEYQDYRNGFAKEIKELRSQEKFERLNNSIRIDYIRETHHTRVETYIKNLSKRIGDAFPQKAWGKQLTFDLASICRAHGEDISFVDKLNTNTQYYGSDSTNLQFISVMLRLGDIIHFSFDRAPLQLRSSTLFKSEYSFQQWAIKNSGVNYNIEKGKISFSAFCDEPESYFKLHQYIDWIEYEIQNYFKYQREWNDKYDLKLKEKVNRDNIQNDESVFSPKRGLGFSLNQNKIIELLMGVGLYKDKFSCLREIYQNSLDACKCMISQNKSNDLDSKGNIEFGIDTEDEKTYLYCLDNGIGMNEEIIENYLLNIGNSYYKSPSFFKEQAKWGGDFTPTSQFGIGILSCFMIGDKIEIITKKQNKNHISCTINGPHENFYYKTVNELEKELVPNSGTLIKIYLNNDIKNSLNNNDIEKLGLLLLGKPNFQFGDFNDYEKYYTHWENNLYNIINKFIKIVPNNINVKIELENKKINILSLPIILNEKKELLGITNEDTRIVNTLNKRRFHIPNKKIIDIKENEIVNYNINIKYKDIEFKSILTIPKNRFDSNNYFLNNPILTSSNLCIDGINIEHSNPSNFEYYYLYFLSHIGVINFTGDIRPQLSVDRLSITKYPDNIEDIFKEISNIYLEEVLNITLKHIDTYKINEIDKLTSIWNYILKEINFADSILLSKLSKSIYGDIKLPELESLSDEEITIKEFLTKETLTIKNFVLSNYELFIQKVLLTKIINSSKIELNENSITIISEQNKPIKNIYNNNHFDEDYKIIVKQDKNKNQFINYDIITNLYPFVNKNLFDKIHHTERRTVDENRVIMLQRLGNGINAFFEQNTLLVDEEAGLYRVESNHNKNKTTQIRNFERKCSDFWLFEINGHMYQNKEKIRYIITVFISAQKLTEEQESELEKIKDTHTSYYNGVKNGWSLLVTGMQKENIIIIPGECSKGDLVNKISDSFWEEYNEFTFKFVDESIVKDYKIG